MLYSKKTLLSLLLLLALLSPMVISSTVQAEDGALVAVMPFEEAELDWFGFKKKEILNGITQMTADRLVHVDGIRVVERSQLEKILEEQNFSQTHRVNPATAAELGKLLGVDALVLGVVNQMDVEESGGLSVGPLKVSGLKATVNIGIRIVSVETAEIVGSYKGTGNAKDASFSVSDLKGLSFGSEAFSKSVLGKSIEEAVKEAVAKVGDDVDNLTFGGTALEGKVMKILGNKLIVNIGKNKGIRKNQVGEIIRLVPVDGMDEPVSMPIGKVEAYSVDDKATIVTVINTQEGVKVGDIVRFEKI